jgi:hypothetical protein
LGNAQTGSLEMLILAKAANSCTTAAGMSNVLRMSEVVTGSDHGSKSNRMPSALQSQ